MTKIFKNRIEFLQWQDKTVNGVDQDFADEYPDYEKQNETNDGCWNCSDCSGCSGCSGCSRCSDCSDCSDCSRCSDCSDCSRCSDCSGCSRCSGCSGCSGLENAAPVQQKENPDAGFKVPVIENIHQKVLEVVSVPDAFDMTSFHVCETTHCRAGWVIHLAGPAGYALEKKTDPVFAAMQIYHKSSPDIPVSPVRFFEDNATAMEDIKACAEKEKATV